jgi:hypothetical protein
MATLRATIDASIAATYSGGGAAPAIATLAAADPIGLTSGTGDYQSDLLYANVRSLATAASDNLDLSGSLIDPLGNVVSAVEITAIVLRADATNTTNLTVGNGATPFIGPFGAATHTLQLQPGGVIVLVAPKAGWPVTAATADILKITNAAGATAGYTIAVTGRSA